MSWSSAGGPFQAVFEASGDSDDRHDMIAVFVDDYYDAESRCEEMDDRAYDEAWFSWMPRFSEIDDHANEPMVVDDDDDDENLEVEVEVEVGDEDESKEKWVYELEDNKLFWEACLADGF